jgi:hypothetical protein
LICRHVTAVCPLLMLVVHACNAFLCLDMIMYLASLRGFGGCVYNPQVVSILSCPATVETLLALVSGLTCLLIELDPTNGNAHFALIK